jgi:hypothetical protein
MTIIAQDILTDVRYILSDTSVDRWSDARLLSLLNAGIADVAKYTTLFIETTYYIVQNNVVDIDLAPLVSKIVRAEYLDTPLPFKSFEEMDKKSDTWQLDKGTEVKALVYDKQKNGLLKQYPIVTNSQNDLIVYNGTFGIITDITHNDVAPTTVDALGDLGDLPSEGIIKFYYVRNHTKVTDINTVLDIDELVGPMLKHYIAGMAFRDNQDTQNRALSNEELGLYTTMMEKYNIEKAQGFVRPNHTVAYNSEGV